MQKNDARLIKGYAVADDRYKIHAKTHENDKMQQRKEKKRKSGRERKDITRDIQFKGKAEDGRRRSIDRRLLQT